MKVLVLTGGVAVGKSTVLDRLKKLGGESLAFYDCDAAAAKILASGELAEALENLFGDEAVTETGAADKAFIRNIVFHNEKLRKELEGLVHPLLEKEILAEIEKARQNPLVCGFIVDIPLYYETSFTCGENAVCVVAVSAETQRSRLAERNHFDQDMVEAILAAQWPLPAKMQKADFVLWNEGPIELLNKQTERFYNHYFMNEEEQDLLPREQEDLPEVPQEQLEPKAEMQEEAPLREPMPPVCINQLREMPLVELQETASVLPPKHVIGAAKSQLIFDLGRYYLKEGRDVFVEGVMEQAKDNYAMLRDPAKSFRTSLDDIYLSGELIKKHGLRVGHLVRVKLRPLRPHDKYLSASEVVSVEGLPVEEFRAGTEFEKLTPLFPRERIILENKEIGSPAMRVLDLITPFGMGQRGLIVAPPRGGKTILLKTIARSIKANYKDVELIILLLDERPEEVTDFEETIQAPVYASTFDEPSRRHAQISDLVIERAKRLVEQGKDVVIMLDSLTRLARGYNANQSGGRIMSGGLGSNALEKPRKFFGAARNVEEGGSLTILATCLVDTESRMDEVIFEEFKGTGNMEIRLDRELAERRIYPAINISQSGTRNDDRLYNEQEFQKILQVRRQLSMLPGWEGLESLLKNIDKTQNNAELVILGLRN